MWAGPGAKTPTSSGPLTTNCLATVSTTPPATTITVSYRPDHWRRNITPGQSSHQNAIIARTGRAKVMIGPSTSSECTAPFAPIASSTASGTTKSRPISPRRG